VETSYPYAAQDSIDIEILLFDVPRDPIGIRNSAAAMLHSISIAQSSPAIACRGTRFRI